MNTIKHWLRWYVYDPSDGLTWFERKYYACRYRRTAMAKRTPEQIARLRQLAAEPRPRYETPRFPQTPKDDQ